MSKSWVDERAGVPITTVGPSRDGGDRHFVIRIPDGLITTLRGIRAGDIAGPCTLFTMVGCYMHAAGSFITSRWANLPSPNTTLAADHRS